MKRILAITVLALSLAGCANLPNPFASITNPFSTPTLATVEAAYGTALSIAVGYHDACSQRLIPPSCRPIVQTLQTYGLKAQAAIVSARNFVKNYPTINAASAISAAQAAVSDFQNAEASNGVK